MSHTHASWFGEALMMLSSCRRTGSARAFSRLARRSASSRSRAATDGVPQSDTPGTRWGLVLSVVMLTVVHLPFIRIDQSSMLTHVDDDCLR